VEGPTENEGINQLRQQMRKNLIATLMFSQGVRMLLGGDEMGRTQLGNNNAYCQDNEIAWVHWDDAEDVEFVRSLSRLRRDHPVFRRRRFFTGTGTGAAADIAWLTPAGESMTDQDWNVGFAKSLGVFLNGDAITEPDPRGRRVRDDSFLLLINAGSEPVEFTLPGPESGERWEFALDTAEPGTVGERPRLKARDTVAVGDRALLVLRRGA
jgi:glycogen operon protein